jgi:hypothetical protein
MLLAMLVASALGDSLALAAVFFVLFPAVITGLIIFAIAQGLGERRANQNYHRSRRGQGPSQG